MLTGISADALELLMDLALKMSTLAKQEKNIRTCRIQPRLQDVGGGVDHSAHPGQQRPCY